MAVQEELDASGCALRWDVDEMEFQVFPDEREFQRPRMGVVVSADNVKRNSELLEFDKSLRGADVSQMPDFVRRLKHGGQTGRITVMGIGKHGDAHGRFQSDAGPRVTQNRRSQATKSPCCDICPRFGMEKPRLCAGCKLKERMNFRTAP